MWSSRINITWKLVRNAHSQALSRIHWIIILRMGLSNLYFNKTSSGFSRLLKSLRTTTQMILMNSYFERNTFIIFFQVQKLWEACWMNHCKRGIIDWVITLRLGLKAKPKTKIKMQVVFLKSNTRKQELGSTRVAVISSRNSISQHLSDEYRKTPE